MNDIDGVMWRYATLEPRGGLENIMDILSEDERPKAISNNIASYETKIETNKERFNKTRQ